ncbi:DUF2378 family protein [Archangium violaceum]|uniref:DUF2378 family protein n=1 Tax=Archangium violaceum TaxID=83451 RepID=UPI00194FBD49|nr:DUF2378 family protein [Archangium violaceum]QRN96617.1 DUF2378 family protein [Archangium violaceum]
MLMTDERVVFGNAFHGVFQIALNGKLSAAARSALGRMGLHIDRQPLSFYPLSVWRPSLDIIVRDLFPNLPLEEAYRLLGRKMVLDVSETVLGRGALALGRALGPRRLLMRMNHNFRNIDNYVQMQLTELAPTQYEVFINETLGVPSYYQGLLEAALGSTGAREPHVQRVRTDGTSCTYRVEWRS